MRYNKYICGFFISFIIIPFYIWCYGDSYFDDFNLIIASYFFIFLVNKFVRFLWRFFEEDSGEDLEEDM